MADEVTSDEIRTHRFDVVRKGYDRTQVETFLAKMARQIDTLESRIAEISNGDLSLGIEDDEALAREMAVIGDEINTILEAARSAAEGMRTRATANAESWTSEADTQARTVREAAWVEGSTLLEAAIDEAQMMVAEAETDALRIRAEAEREAIRYTTDAKRLSEEAIGAAENEAEGILTTARAESERHVRTANQSAEIALERARALEDRRAELLVELESTRSSIGDLETEFEAKRQVLVEPEPVVALEYGDHSHHDSDSGSVRIVSASKAVSLTPVDADSFVAEVAELHRARPVEAGPPFEDGSQFTVDSSRPEEDSRQPEAPFLDSSLPQPAGGDVGERDRGGSSEPTPDTGRQIPQEARPSVVSQGVDDGDQTSEALLVAGEEVSPDDDGGEGPAESASQDGSKSEALEAPPPFEEGQVTSDREQPEDAIGSLFAQLREAGQQTEDGDQTSEVSHVTAEEGTPKEDGGDPAAESGSDTEIPVGVDSGEQTAESVSLIPVQNTALRSIKRQLVDLQNDALEHLRVDTAWVPEEAFTDCFSEPFGELASSIADSDDDGGAAEVFATDLYDAVSSAVVATREAGSGDRAIAAATSKVFRTWRSDEAERRVVAVASELSERN
jgi:DivIVA domain-containing protein